MTPHAINAPRPRRIRFTRKRLLAAMALCAGAAAAAPLPLETFESTDLDGRAWDKPFLGAGRCVWQRGEPVQR